MNLIHDAWLPIRRRSGATERIAPWQVTKRFAADPVIALASPRADFDGALVQFLLGLLETALTLPGAGERLPRPWRTPPDPSSLRDAFAPLAGAFELFGSGARFLQDRTLESEGAAEEPIERLLIEAPGANTAKLGKDHFVKAGRVRCLCPACAASAVLTLQINAPSGGQGHRTGIRGGGPLTTLVVDPESLWGTLEANLLAAFSPDRSPAGKPEDRFPWLAPTRTSERGTGRETTREDVDPLQIYWAMPRRLRLVAEAAEAASCDLCGAPAEPAVRGYLALNLGVNYTGPWEHPLSPHGVDVASGLSFPVKGGQLGPAYRHWLGLVQSFEEGRRYPARVVTEFKRRLDRGEDRGRAEYQLWAFGYDMDNMKARAWVESRMPLFRVRPEHREAYERQATALVRAARHVERALVFAAQSVVSGRPEEVGGDPGDLVARFWEETEAPFFAHLRQLQAVFEADGTAIDPRPIRVSWSRSLGRAARRGFEGFCGHGFLGTTDPRRIALAWKGLRRSLSGPRLEVLLDLAPLPETAEVAKASEAPESELAYARGGR